MLCCVATALSGADVLTENFSNKIHVLNCTWMECMSFVVLQNKSLSATNYEATSNFRLISHSVSVPLKMSLLCL
jgi:hypothetical protein